MTAEPPRYDVADIKTVPADEVHLGYQRHAALAQYFRWNQRSETSAASAATDTDLIDTAATFGSDHTGAAAGRERLGRLPNALHDAHDVKTTAVTINPDASIALTARVAYRGPDGLPDSMGQGADLSYSIAMRPSETILPKITGVEITRHGDTGASPFVSHYASNRIKSLVYYWLALIDNPSRDAEPFKEVFTDDFALNFSVGKLDSFEKFKAWYFGNAALVRVSTHIINSLTIDEIAPNNFKVVADFDWQGILANGTNMVGRTIDSWIMIDNPAERFARIKTEDVEIVIPFQPRP